MRLFENALGEPTLVNGKQIGFSVKYRQVVYGDITLDISRDQVAQFAKLRHNNSSKNAVQLFMDILKEKLS